MQTKATSLCIPQKMREKIARLCEKTQKPMAVIVREAIENYLERIEEKEVLQKFINQNFERNDASIKNILKKLIKEIIKEEARETGSIGEMPQKVGGQ